MPYLQFKGKTAVETYHFSLPHHTLEPDSTLSLLADGNQASLDGNIIVEGDNLLALKALLPTHSGRIKCIYIDPPYNTGEESWVYNDNLEQPLFKEWFGKVVGRSEEDPTRHDKWCCMMYPRLRLLKELLSPDGVLFASIDENEHGHLRLMLDEIFGADKPLATFVWKRRSPSGLRKDLVSVDHEYVLLYARDPNNVSLEGLVTKEEDYPLVDNQNRRYANTDLTIGSTAEDRPNQFYDITNPRSGVSYPASASRVWRFEPDKMAQVIKDDLVIWPDEAKGDITRPRFKTVFDPLKPKVKPVSSWIDPSSKKDADISAEEEEFEIEVITSGLNAEGGKVLSRIMGRKVFDYPKPPSLLVSLLKIATKKGDIVLDSFAGSGTTAQAALELNSERDLGLKFILVQVPSETLEQKADGENIARDVTRERVVRIMQGYSHTTARGKEVEVEGFGGEFSYFTLSDKPLLQDLLRTDGALPEYGQVAKYVYFTETSKNWNPGDGDKRTGKLGSTNNTSFYLLYSQDPSVNMALDKVFLDEVAAFDPLNEIVVYCEQIWIHREDLRRWEVQSKKRIRPMQIPFEFK